MERYRGYRDITEIMLKTASKTKQSIHLPQYNRNNVKKGIKDQTINMSAQYYQNNVENGIGN